MNEPFSSMLLWLPTSDLNCPNEFSFHAEQVSKANDAVLDFGSCQLSLSDTLERLDFYGVDVDDYLLDLDAHLRYLGA
jgi:hypothetical protein